MRPAATKDSSLRTPLDDILGYPANIRLLRCLVEANTSMSISALAKRTGISVPGIHKAVSRLMKTGIIRYVGSGRTQLIELRNEHPMFRAISTLFNAERELFEFLLDHLKLIITDLQTKPESAWIYGPVATGSDDYGDPLKVALLGDLQSVDAISDQFRERAKQTEIEKRFDVTIEVKGITTADEECIEKSGKIILWGPEPHHYLDSANDSHTSIPSHRELEDRSRQYASYWIQFLKKHPEVIERTITHLDKQIQQSNSGVQQELTEWKHILESTSLQRLKKIMESDSDRSNRLRQSLPFWPVLTEEERNELQQLTDLQ